jgi:hypothetical protein
VNIIESQNNPNYESFIHPIILENLKNVAIFKQDHSEKYLNKSFNIKYTYYKKNDLEYFINVKYNPEVLSGGSNNQYKYKKYIDKIKLLQNNMYFF